MKLFNWLIAWLIDLLFNKILVSSIGDLKLVEKPSPITMAPHDFANIKASVKVASTENGVIFGNIGEHFFDELIPRQLSLSRSVFPFTECVLWFFPSSVYDLKSGVSDRNCVYLSNIQVDIMDYIIPASCTDLEFRQMWAEFEWENKVGHVPLSRMKVSMVFSWKKWV